MTGPVEPQRDAWSPSKMIRALLVAGVVALSLTVVAGGGLSAAGSWGSTDGGGDTFDGMGVSEGVVTASDPTTDGHPTTHDDPDTAVGSTRDGEATSDGGEVTDSGDLTDDGTGGNDETTLVDDEGTFRLEAGPGQAVEGWSNRSVGSALEVRLEVYLSDDDAPFVQTRSATVDRHGSFWSVFDLSNVPVGTPYEVVVADAEDGSQVANATGVVEECASACDRVRPDHPARDTELLGEDPLTLDVGPERVVRGETPLPPGSEVQVRLHASGDDPFLFSEAATVDADGTFRAAFDLSFAVDPGRFTLTVLDRDADAAADRTLVEAEGELVECRDACAAPNPRDHYAFGVGGELESHHTVERTAIPRSSLTYPRVSIETDETVVVPISLADEDAATITIVQRDVDPSASNFSLDATVADGTGDDRVLLVFDAEAARGGAEQALFPADPGDEVTVDAQRGGLTADEYVLWVSADSTEPLEPSQLGRLTPGDEEPPDDVLGIDVNEPDPDEEARYETRPEPSPSPPPPGPGDRVPIMGFAALVVAGILGLTGVTVLAGSARL